jgi:hypothetical protein
MLECFKIPKTTNKTKKHSTREKDIVFDQCKENNILLIEILNDLRIKNNHIPQPEYNKENELESMNIKLDLILHKLNILEMKVNHNIQNQNQNQSRIRLW